MSTIHSNGQGRAGVKKHHAGQAGIRAYHIGSSLRAPFQCELILHRSPHDDVCLLTLEGRNASLYRAKRVKVDNRGEHIGEKRAKANLS